MSSRVELIRDSLRKALIANALGEKAVTEISAMKFNQLVCAYVQWADKSIRPSPRKIMCLDSFDGSVTSSTDQERLKELIIDIEAGIDLSPYLSHRATTSLGTNKKQSKGIEWADSGGTYDMFLNSHGVHHLHLNPADKNGKRHGDSDALLFVGFLRAEAVFLMLGDHKSFNDGSLLEAAAEYQAALGFTLKGVSAPQELQTNIDHQKLLRNGVSGIKVTNDGDIVPSSIASAGNGMFHMMHSNKICSFVQQCEQSLDSKEGRKTFFKENGVTVSEGADLGYYFNFCDFGLADKLTQTSLLHIPWRR